MMKEQKCLLQKVRQLVITSQKVIITDECLPDSVDNLLFVDSSESADKPHAIQIVQVLEDHTFDLDMEALKEVLLSDEVKNRKVVVLSVAGAFRKGKSFLLDYLLRYLNNKVGNMFETARGLPAIIARPHKEND